ncbi:MAG: hypothetical protein ABGW91_07770 [Christiangramia sp.]
MGKKLRYSFLLTLLFLPLFSWGQCPTAVSISSSEGNNICQGTEVTFTANVTNGTSPFTYQWQIDGSNVGSATNSNTYTSSSLSNNQKISVIVTDANGSACSVTSSAYTMTVNTNRTPGVSLTSSTNSVCPGQNVTFTATSSYGGPNPQYDWYINSSSSPAQSGSSNTFTTAAFNSGSNTVKVVLTSNYSCVTNTTAEATSPTITVRPGTPSQPGSISGTVEICPGTTQTYSIAAVPDASSYVWTLPSGWSGNSTNNSINITVGSSSGTISVAAKNDCGTSTTRDLAITVKPGTPAQPGTITGEASVCPGISQTYSISSVVNAAAYNWTVPSGWTITGSDSGNSIDVTTGTSGGSISVSAYNDCGTSNTKTLNVSVQPGTPATPGSISGETEVCPGTTNTYSISPVNGATTYNWTLPSGWSGSSTTNSIQLTAGSSGGTIEVEAINNCGTSSAQTLNITVKPGTPAVPSTINGNTAVCPGTTETYTIAEVPDATSYTWTIPNGWSGTSTSNSITLTTGSSGNGAISVKAENDCGISTAQTLEVSVKAPAPVAPGSITGDTEVCSSATGLTYSVGSVTDASWYEWILPAGWNITSSNPTSNTITVSASANSGDIRVSAHNDCGGSSETSLAVNSVNGVPNNPGTITTNLPNDGICPPATGITFTVANDVNANGYDWVLPSGWEITNGQNTSSITVRVNASSPETNNASVSVSAKNICGSSTASTYSGITIKKHVQAYIGEDMTLCQSTNPITINGSIGFNGKLKISQVTTTGGGTISNVPNGKVNNFSFIYTPNSSDFNSSPVKITLITEAPGGGACGPGSDEMLIYFIPTSTITSPANKDQQVCINTALTNMAFTIGGGATGATITGLPSGLSGNYNAGTFTISGTPTQTGSFTYTISTTGNCSGQQTSTTGTITVTDDDLITDANNKDQEICINTAVSPMVFGTNNPITAINTSGLPAGLSGSLSNNQYTISGTPTEAGTFNYTLTSVGSCNSTTTSGTLVVNPDVTITSTSETDQEICINTALETIEFSITEPGTNAIISGLPDGITTSFSNGVFSISGNPTEAGTFPYTVTTQGDCQQATATGTITVKPDPTAELSYTGDFCESQSGTVMPGLTGSGEYENGTYSSSPSGLSINTSTGEITPGDSDPGTYTVTYTTPEICAVVTAETTVVINATPYAEISYTDPLCNNDIAAYLPVFANTEGNYEGGSFSAQPAGLDINASTGEIAPKTSDPNTYTISYTIPASGGCQEVILNSTIEITQNPQVSIEYPEAVCTSETDLIPVTFTSTAGEYTGGAFSGTSGLDIDANGNINAANSTPGVHTITYTLTAAAGCDEVIATTDVQINEKVTILTEPQNVGICSSEPAQFEVSASGDGLSYQWYRIVEGTPQLLAGEDDAVFSLSNATSVDAGEYYVVVSGADSCSEATSETVTLNVDENIIIVKPTEDLTICEEDYTEITFEFIAHANGAPLTFQWIKDGNPINDDGVNYDMEVSAPQGTNGEYTGTLTILDIAEEDSGVYAVEIDGPEYFTCPQATSKNFTFRVNPIPDNPETTDLTFCLNDTASNLSVDNPDSDYEYSWYSYDSSADEFTYIGDNYTPSTSSPGTTTYYVTQKLVETGCESGMEPLVVTVLDKPEPVATETIQLDYCFEEVVETAISLTPAENASIHWYAADGETEISAPTPNTSSAELTIYYVSQIFDTGCESDLTKVEVNVKSLPDLSAGIAEGSSSSTCLRSTINLTASGAETYVWTLNGDVVGNEASLAITTDETGDFTYIVEGTANGCSTTYEVPISVDAVTVPGSISGPESVCINNASGTLELTGYTGNITEWQWKASSSAADAWTKIDDAVLDTRNFSNLTESTDFRAVVKNGACEEAYATFNVRVDQLPQGGNLTWPNGERIFLTCEVQSNDLHETLTLNDFVGQIVEWEYRTASNMTWSTYDSQDSSLTNSDFQNILGSTVESTVFRVKIANGACSDGTYSQTAILSVIPSDIKPSPVQVTPQVLCYGADISLSSETGYGAEYGQFDGGAFDNAGIKNHGWNFTNPSGGSNDFDSGANNGRADHWLRMNPHGSDPENEKVYTANLYPISSQSPSNGSMVNFRTFSSNAGNKGFALVTGNNDSNMETPVFSLGSLDEAILTFDQAYNLTEGAKIYVEISTNGGSTYNTVLFEMTGTATSGNYNNFGDGTPQSRPLNKMVIDLGDYLGQSNLRIRFRFDGTIDGDVWAVDNIKVPEGPQDVLLQWFYDEDASDPDNALEQIGQDNQNVVSFTPRKIGWNDFEVKTALLLDSNGDPCETINNSETVRVFVFDQYTTTVVAETGECGNTIVQLSATITGNFQGDVTSEFATDDLKTLDGYTGAWVITGPNTDYTLTNADQTSTLEPVNNPNAIFEGSQIGDYSFSWQLTPTAVDENDVLIENTGCPPVITPAEVSLPECTTLDFDGVNDFVSIQDGFADAKTIEMWIYPEDSDGVILSGPGVEIRMSDLPTGVTPNSRWYHIALIGTKLYVDGIDSGTSINGTGTAGKTIIGAKWNASTKAAEDFYSGWIDEVRIWKVNLSEKQLHFMMNQRLDLASKGSGQIVQGEAVPNLYIDAPSSYHSDGIHNLDKDDVPFYNVSWDDLIAYYRLISEFPDPDLNIIPNTYKPVGGYTPDLALTAVDGRLHNMTTHQQNTSPTPYFSGADGAWDNSTTWARPTVWDAPDSNGFDGTEIEWNIARLNHNINSGNRNIIMLGVLSESNLLTINADNALSISHYLLLNGNIDLVGESQLLQDHGSILDDSSGGWLQRDQQGRMSSFNYNYWTSPVTDQGTTNNSGFTLNKVMLDGTDEDKPQGITWKGQYFAADGSRTSPITISDYWIWDFKGGEADVYGDWHHLGSSSKEIAGAGFSMKGTDGTVAPNTQKQNYTFQGKPHNGDITLNIGQNQNYLLGNPYASALDVYEFLLDNLPSTITAPDGRKGRNTGQPFNGTLYYWSHFAGSTHILEEYIGGYAYYSFAGSTPAYSSDWRIDNSNPNASDSKIAQRYIPVAQGFFVNSSGGNFSGNIYFNNNQRRFAKESSDPSIFLQQEEREKGQLSSIEADKRAKLRLKFKSPAGYHRQILVTRDENSSSDFDLGYDAPLIENNKEDMYWIVNDSPYVIQAVPDFEQERVLPIGFKTKEGGEFKIQIDSTENWPSEIPIYLKDKVVDSIQEITKQPYTATAEAGEIKDRFEIVFFKPVAEDPVIDPEIPEVPVVDGLVGISYSHFSRQVKITNFDHLDVEKVMVFDLGGKLIETYDEMPTDEEILLKLPPVQSGIYIVKVFCSDAMCNKKIIVK